MSKVTFNNKKAIFFQSLKADVDKYFAENGIRKTGNRQLHIKTIVLIVTSLALYLSLPAVVNNAPVAIAFCLMLGFTLSAIGFNVMHDACHGSYSRRKWVNELLGLTLNALGGNAFIWKQKHNIIHHTYTNVDGVDDDIAKSPVIRQCHTQKWYPVHRAQHIYLWFIYALSSFLWIFVMDISKYSTQRIYTTQLTKMSTSEHVIFWVSKILYVVFYMAIPIYMFGLGKWAVGFACMHAAMGLSMSVVFQLAHVVEETEFEYTGGEDKQIENEWAIHQIKTTANFAPDNKIVSWLAGGLNYQIEHHLFPRISHVHYPALSKIVARKCTEYDLKYNSMPTVGAAILSHYRFMKTLGSKPE